MMITVDQERRLRELKAQTVFLPCKSCDTTMQGIVTYENYTQREICWTCQQEAESAITYDEQGEAA